MFLNSIVNAEDALDSFTFLEDNSMAYWAFAELPNLVMNIGTANFSAELLHNVDAADPALQGLMQLGSLMSYSGAVTCPGLV